MVAAMFTLPVAGTALYMVDQHLHPRTLATTMILLAVWRILDEKPWQAAPLLLVAFLLHALMGAMGISFCIFLIMVLMGRVHEQARGWNTPMAAFMPLGWIFEPGNPGWRKALDSKAYETVSTGCGFAAAFRKAFSAPATPRVWPGAAI